MIADYGGGGIVDYRGRVRHAEVLLESSPISETNKRAIRRFMDFKTAQRISLPRPDKYLRLLRLLAERYIDGKDFEELTREDVISAVAKPAPVAMMSTLEAPRFSGLKTQGRARYLYLFPGKK